MNFLNETARLDIFSFFGFSSNKMIYTLNVPLSLVILKTGFRLSIKYAHDPNRH